MGRLPLDSLGRVFYQTEIQLFFHSKHNDRQFLLLHHLPVDMPLEYVLPKFRWRCAHAICLRIVQGHLLLQIAWKCLHLNCLRKVQNRISKMNLHPAAINLFPDKGLNIEPPEMTSPRFFWIFHPHPDKNYKGLFLVPRQPQGLLPGYFQI